MLWQEMIYNGIVMRKIFLVLLFLCAALPAWSAEPYVISGVSVDVTADNSAAARDQAMVEAQRKAFMNLATQLVPGKPIPNVSDKAIGDMVSDFHIEQEKFGGNRYVGTFTFRFRQNPVRTAFGAAAIPSPHELAERNTQATAPQTTQADSADGSGNIASVVSNAAVQPLSAAEAAPVVTSAAVTAAAKMGTLMEPSSAPDIDVQNILVEIPAHSARELDMAQDHITGAPGVMKTELRSISSANAVMLLSYQGDLPQVLQNLSARGVNLQSKAPTVPPLYTLLP